VHLAASCPVIIQETGFTQNYGSDAGLLAFCSLGEIADAVKMINADYAKHSRAARKIAREAFEPKKFCARCLTAQEFNRRSAGAEAVALRAASAGDFTAARRFAGRSNYDARCHPAI